MWRILCVVFVAVVCGSYAVTNKEFNQLKKAVAKMEKSYNSLIANAQKTQTAQMVALARQVSLQQLYVEEMTRASGDSGLKLTRMSRTGSKSYFSNTFAGRKVAAIHDHTNYKTTVGMGELVVVLNGVEFRTRHNDYKLNMPSRSSKDFGKVEEIPFPEVPPAILAKKTLDEQIAEMKEWFKAWLNSDYSERDYRKYFQANLCYMEGMWTTADGSKIDEPFASDRHAIEASSFFDLQEKVRFTAATGRKSTGENFAYLPTTISHVDEHGNVKYAQWNYKILCHPLQRQVPLTRFRLIDDLANRVADGKDLEAYRNSRMARFSLYDDVKDTVYPKKSDTFHGIRGSFMDLLMSEIPGKDNYPADLYDDAFNNTAYAPDARFYTEPSPAPINAGYYHNRFKILAKDAMGLSVQRRGFSDANLYVAYNTQSKIAESKATFCKGKRRRKVCTDVADRVSYAIPLEIVYTTPLQSWNPYHLKYYASVSEPATAERANDTYLRTGGPTKDLAYAGVSRNKYYMTPIEFYEQKKTGKVDKADTAKSSVNVLDKKKVPRPVAASGIQILTKNIPDVGVARLRYPVMPLHQAGNMIYKEVDALKDMTLMAHKYSTLYPDSRMDNGTIEPIYTFEMEEASKDPPGLHIHTIELTGEEIEDLKAGKALSVLTSTDNAHDHQLEIFVSKAGKLQIRRCDGKRKCWDGHSNRLNCLECRFDLFT